MLTTLVPPIYGQTYFLVAVRLMAALTAAPIVGSRIVPIPLRVGLALLLALVLSPVVPSAQMPGTVAGYVPAVIREVLIGLLAGFGVHLVFLVVQFAAGLIGIQMNLSMAGMLDPLSAERDTVLERFMVAVATLIFLQVDGLHLFLLGLQKLFVALPLGGPMPATHGAEPLVATLGAVFLAAVRMAMPMLGALLMADVGLAIAARTVPQLNLFAVGIPVKLGLGLFSLSLCMPPLTAQLVDLYRRLPLDMSLLAR